MTSSTDPRRRHPRSHHGTGPWRYPGSTPWRRVATLLGGVWLPRLAGNIITPAPQNLDVAFQGLNTWHSFQYLAVVIFLNRLRQARGTIGSATVARFASRGWVRYAS